MHQTETRTSRERLSFSGHESFPLRYSWLPKAVRGVSRQPDIFTSDDAATVLGVGKNMAASIRHWALTTGMIATSDRQGTPAVTPLGGQLFGPDGWDPYLEDVGTVWLIHWQMVRAISRASTWHLAFSHYPDTAFTRDALVAWIMYLAGQLPGTRATAGSIRRDVDVFIRTYAGTVGAADRYTEDSLDSPLVELGLLHRAVGTDDGTLWRLDRGDRPTLPIEILAHAIGDYWDTTLPGLASTSFESLSYGPGSPGTAFKLSDTAFGMALDGPLAPWGFRLDETAGMRQVVRDAAPATPGLAEPFPALAAYYTPRNAFARIPGPESPPVRQETARG